MTRRKYLITEFIGEFESEYVCTHCGSLLYVANHLLSGVYCLSKKCPNGLSPEFVITEPTPKGAPLLFREIEELQSSFSSQLSEWDASSLVFQLADQRRQNYLRILDDGVLSIEDLLAIDMLLNRVLNEQPKGHRRNQAGIISLISMAKRVMSGETDLENLGNERLVAAKSEIMSHVNDGFFLLDVRYLRKHTEDLRTQGLVDETSMKSQDADDFFIYQDIEFSELRDGDDESIPQPMRVLAKFWTVGDTLDSIVNKQAWSKRLYEHRLNPHALEILFSWYKRLSDTKNLFLESPELLSQTAVEILQKNGEVEYSVDEFMSEFVDGEDVVPFVVRVPQGILLDKITLFFMCVYLSTQYVPRKYQKITGYSSISNHIAQSLATKYTRWLKRRIEPLGYTCPVRELVVHRQGKYFEYDLIVVDEVKSVIYLVEAKYRRISASSAIGTRLIGNELEGKRGMLYELVRQADRLQFFKANSEHMAKQCRLVKSVDNYRIEAFIVSKSMPIVSRLGEVFWMRDDEFMKMLDSKAALRTAE